MTRRALGPVSGEPMAYLRDSKFVISCCARTGSTYLLTLLRSHPDIMVHGKSLTTGRPGMVWGSYHQKRKDDPEYEAAFAREMRDHPERFIQGILFNSQDRKVAGFKFKTEESFAPAYKAYADVVFDDTDIKVIHLTRRNLLDQYISHMVVLNQTGVTLIHDEKDRPEMRPFKANIAKAVDYCRDVVEREKRSRQVYSRHRTVEVEYENLVDNAGHREAVLDFLGVPRQALATGIKKIIKDSRALVTNIDELAEGLGRAGFEARLA